LRQLLEEQDGVEARQRGAADVGAHIDAAEPERSGATQRVGRKDLVLVPLTGERHHLVAREGAGGVLDGALLLGEVEIHGATVKARILRRQSTPTKQSKARRGSIRGASHPNSHEAELAIGLFSFKASTPL